MLTEHEQMFIRAFVQRERRERATFELASQTKRSAFLHRLAHGYAAVLDMRFLLPIPAPNSHPESLLPFLRQAGATEMCYALSVIDAIDGKQLRLADALGASVGKVTPTILLCTNGRIGYFEAEPERYPPPRFLLRRF